MSCSIKTGIGRFDIDTTWLDGDRWRKLHPVFSGVVVVRCESLLAYRCVEYVALSDRFEPLPPVCVAPKYRVLVKLNALNEIIEVRYLNADSDSRREELEDGWRYLDERY